MVSTRYSICPRSQKSPSVDLQSILTADTRSLLADRWIGYTAIYPSQATTICSITMETERREYDRISVQLSAVLSTGEQYTISCETLDLSAQGVMLECHSTLPAGTACQLKLTLQQQDQQPLTIEAEGIIVRTEGESMAVEFQQVSLDGYHTLRELVEQQKSAADEPPPD